MIKLPLYLTVKYKKDRYYRSGKQKGKLKPNPEKFWLTLNNYRNWHHRVANDLKRQFCDEMREQLEGKVFNTPIKVALFYNRNRDNSDYDGGTPIIIKFFLDALVHYGCIEDDNKTKVLSVLVLPIDCEKDVAYVGIQENINIEDEIKYNNELFLALKDKNNE